MQEQERIEPETIILGAINQLYPRRLYQNPHIWVITRESTMHATDQEHLLTGYKEFYRSVSVQVEFPHQMQLKAFGVGHVVFEHFALKNVIYVPELGCNLISIPRMRHDRNPIFSIKNSILKIYKYADRRTKNFTRKRSIIYSKLAREDGSWEISWTDSIAFL